MMPHAGTFIHFCLGESNHHTRTLPSCGSACLSYALPSDWNNVFIELILYFVSMDDQDASDSNNKKSRRKVVTIITCL